MSTSLAQTLVLLLIALLIGGASYFATDVVQKNQLEHLEESRRVAELRKNLSLNEREVLGLGQDDDVLRLAIADEHTITEDFGWVFFYQSAEFLETGDFSKRLAGNAPIIVSKVDGKLHETGTAKPIEFYIENFRRFGDPNSQ